MASIQKAYIWRMPVFIQSPRFVIRDFKPEEQPLFLELFDDELVTQHLPRRTRKENIEIFRTALQDYAEGKALGRWGIFNNSDGDFIGNCLLRNFYDEPGKIELGYVLRQKYWGRGIASEMAQIMITYGFVHTDTAEIVAVTTLGNIASQKVLQKAGMIRRENLNRSGEELAYFSISAPLTR
ncbi:MAG TPA: GNAT family N-acetyltransferase [Mucilaginibacter sp.]|nr:GNAT family N-acetyltransferase [Mucilaginibacter sp.]